MLSESKKESKGTMKFPDLLYHRRHKRLCLSVVFRPQIQRTDYDDKRFLSLSHGSLLLLTLFNGRAWKIGIVIDELVCGVKAK